MTARPSIAQRLAVALVVGASVMWLSAVLIATQVMREKVNAAFDDTMRQGALRILPLAAHEFAEAIDEDEPEEMAFIEGLSTQGANYNYYVLNPEGRIVVFSGEAPVRLSSERVPSGFFTLEGARAYALFDTQSGFGIVVRERPGIRDTLWRDSAKSMVLPLALLLPFLGGVFYWAVRRALAPMRSLSVAIAARHKSNMAPLGLGAQPQELAPVVQEIDDLLTRLRKAMEAERSFAAESAHELRTPIAGAMAQLQVLSAKLDDPNQQDNLTQSLNALSHLARLSENLLQLSRLDAGFAASESPTHLNPILKLVLAEPAFGALAGHITQHDAPLYAPITADAFAIALRNLLQNAERYRTPGSTITLTVLENGIEISNACPVVAPENLATLRQRYVRGHTDVAKGSGLGLAITAGIAEDVGGSLDLLSPRPSHEDGFTARLLFTPDTTSLMHEA
ncbi:MAG: hypothetical protein JXR13_05775 [Thalassovita sp.]